MSMTGNTAKTKRKNKAGPNSLKAEPLGRLDSLDCLENAAGLFVLALSLSTGTVAGTGCRSEDGRNPLAKPVLSHSNKAFNASIATFISLSIPSNINYHNTNIPDLNYGLTGEAIFIATAVCA
jgi:hypothetical protein